MSGDLVDAIYASQQLIREGRISEAKALAEQCLEAIAHEPPSAEQCVVHRLLGECAASERRHGDARNHYLRAREIADAVDDDDLRSISWEGLGLTELHDGRSRHAARYLEEAVKFATRSGDPVSRAMAMQNHALALAETDPDRAADVLREALTVPELDPDNRAAIALNDGRVLADLGRLDEARGALQESIRLAELTGSAYKIYQAKLCLTITLGQSGQWPERTATFVEAHDLIHRLRASPPQGPIQILARDEEVDALLEEARALVRADRLAEARALQQTAEQTARQKGAPAMLPKVWSEQGLLALTAGHVEQARNLLQQAGEAAARFGDWETQVNVLFMLAGLEQRNSGPTSARALDLLAQTQGLLRLAGEERGSVEASLGFICLHFGALDLAENYLRNAVRLASRGTYKYEAYLPYRLATLLQILVEKGDEAEAMKVERRLKAIARRTEHPRARLLARAVLARAAFGRKRASRELFEQCKAACDDYEEVRQRSKGVGDLAEFRTEILTPYREAIQTALDLDEWSEAFSLLERSKARSLLDSLQEQAPTPEFGKPISVPEVREILAAGTRLVEFFVGHRGVYSFLVTDAGLTVRRVLGPELTELREDYRAALVAAAATDSSEAVERVVRHPIHERLCDAVDGDGGATQTYIVPHEMLHLTPFQLRATPHGDWRQRPGMSYLPSASVLRRPPWRRASDNAVVGGDPLGDLPFARAESLNVAGRYDAAAYVGSAVTADWLESALAETRPALVHLACHGVFDSREGERSGLLLSGASGAELVSLRQLASYDWSDALVVLSSCTSGRHELRAGDELAGLGWAILGGGARALVVSLWRVPDLSTALLMSAFYDALTSPRPDLTQISAALDAAQSWLRDLTARELIEWAISRAKQKGQLVLASRAVMAAHHAAGQIDAYGYWNGIYLQAWEDRLPQSPTDAEWERQRSLARFEGYGRRPFQHPANWASFSLLGPG